MAHPLAKFDAAVGGDALAAAEAALAAAGFSVGPIAKNAPRGVMFGQVAVAAWSRMSRSELLDLHGQMWRDGEGRVSFMLHADAPPAAAKAFYQLLARVEGQQGLAA